MLNFVLGRSGSGKTDCLIRKMRKTENAIYIVPEQYSFAAEKKITDVFGMSGMGMPSVYSFRRLAYRAEELYGGDTGRNIAQTARVMVLGDIVKRLSGKLSLYGGAAKRGEMAGESEVIITTFKKYRITPEKIEKAIEKTNNGLLKKKLGDCALIMKEYEKFLSEGYRDADDLLEGLRKHIENTDYFKNKDIFIDSFQAFTPMEYEVVAELLKKCRSVTISLCIGDGGDEFVTAKRTLDRLRMLAGGIGVPEGETIRLKDAMLTACDELKVLEKSFFEDEETIFREETDRIRIHRAKNEYSEAEAAAAEIERLCREEGYRYRDIVVVARDMENYEKSISRVFDNFNIPIFMDKKAPLSGEAAAIFMLSAIRIISRGWHNSAVFAYMKSVFSPLDAREAWEMENYCLAAGVRAANWKSEEDWDMMPGIYGEDADEAYLKRINESRRRLTEPLIRLEKKIKGKHTGREMCVAFYEFLEECALEEKINAIAVKLEERGRGEDAMRMEQVYELMLGVLESFDDAFCEKQISAEGFLSALSAGVESVEIGVIPSTTDSVCCGSIDRAKGHGARAVIIIGAAEGVFPAVVKETGIFTNADRHELAEYQIELPPDTLGKEYMEESLVYSALTCAEDRLFVSYSVGAEGANPSQIIKRLVKIFPGCVKTDEMYDDNPMSRIGSAKSTYESFVVEYAKIKKGGEAKDEWLSALEFYKNSPIWKDKVREVERFSDFENRSQFIYEELLAQRYGEGIDTSVSRLESYAKCPFSYFASVTLGLKERRELEVTAADSGTFLHDFVDMFGKQLAADGRTWRDVDEEYIDKKTEEISIELIKGLNRHMLESSPRVRHLFVQLKRIAKKSVTVLSEHMKKGQFEPLGYEISFDKDGKIKPLTIQLPNGRRARLRGRVDRADILTTKRGSFVRIIDYKSGEKKFSMSDIYHGFDLQLAVYLTTLCENGGYKPAGMLYFRLEDPIVEMPLSMNMDEARAEAMKTLKMDGLVLEDDEILSAMDFAYSAGSDVIPVKKNKNGSFDRFSKVATEGEFAALSKHVKSAVRRLCNEILAGESSISPVKGACARCQMKALCGFDQSIKGCSYREIGKLNDKDALLKIIEEQKSQD